MPLDGGHDDDLYLSPLSDAKTVADVENFPWPDRLDPARFEGIKEKADKIVYEEKKAYICGRMSLGMGEHAIWMTGCQSTNIKKAVKTTHNNKNLYY